MLIQITIEAGPPVTGKVAIDGAGEQPFVGWLELLHILADTTELAEPVS